MIRSEDEEMFVHAKREFEILKRLENCANIVRGIDYYEERERHRAYLVME